MKFKYQLFFNFILKTRFLKISLLSLLFIFSFTVLNTFAHMTNVNAISYNYTSYLMDDSTLRASFTMSSAAIQTFLQNEGSGLATFSDIENCGPSNGPHYTFYAAYYHCGSSELASQIIYDSSQAYGINPQVILAMMQKEQSLITTPNPVSSQLNYAMGYGCADSATTCTVSGFFNQVDNGTWQLRANFELINGNNYWGYAPSAYPCNGATNFYSNALKPGNNITFYDGYGNAYISFVLPDAATADFYCYTPHVFPGSSSQYYSGYYWFVYYYSLWFGGTTTPYAFMSSTSSAVYLYVDGYKVVVPSMAILQDYGVSPASIQTFTQSYVDSIPSPTVGANGISPVLSNTVQATNDPRIFLVTLGQKYTFTDMQQFYGFSFNTAGISYLPLSFIASINGSGYLSDYIQNTHNSVFQINAGYKRIIFDYPTFSSLDPSNSYTPVSDFVANSIPSSLPISNNALLVKNSVGTVFLYRNNVLYGIPSLDIYNCWGLTTTLNLTLYQPAYDSDVSFNSSNSNLSSCIIDNGLGSIYLLNGSNKYSIPANYGSYSTTMAPDQNLLALVAAIPTNNSGLSQVINTAGSPVVWYLENGVRKSISSLNTLSQLGYSASQITTLNSYVLSSIPASGIKLADGEAVKSSTGQAVYMISGNSRVLFSSGDDFNAYNFNWSNIETLPQSILDTYYPYNNVVIEKYAYNFSNNTSYLIDKYGCYTLSQSQLSSYGQSTTSIINNQNYSGGLFRNLNLSKCGTASIYATDPTTGVVYEISNGTKYPFSSWNSLVNTSGSSNPNIINLSTSTLSTLPTGSSI